MQVEQIDTRNEIALAKWVSVANASIHHERPTDPELTLQEASGRAHGFGVVETVLSLARTEDGEVVGSSMLSMPERDNTWTAELNLYVLPSHRLRGVGRALVTQAEQLAASHGRRIISAWSESDIGAG